MSDPNTTPALPPPPGVVPNFVDPYSQQPKLVAASVICLVICSLSTVARVYTRSRLLNQLDHNDWILMLALVLFTVFTALQLAAGEFGQGRHMWNVTQAQIVEMSKLLNAIEIVYGPAMFTAKYVVLRQIETVFLGHQRRRLAYKVVAGLIWANAIFYAAISFSFVFACVPREAIWNPAVPATCIDTHASIIATSAINVVSDLTLLIVPMAGIWKLQMPLKRKLGAGAVFAVGLFANISSVIRLYYSVELTHTHDLTWAIHPVAAWALAEFTTVFFCACFPFFPRLAKKILGRDKLSSSAAANGGSSSYYYGRNKSSSYHRSGGGGGSGSGSHGGTQKRSRAGTTTSGSGPDVDIDMTLPPFSKLGDPGSGGVNGAVSEIILDDSSSTRRLREQPSKNTDEYQSDESDLVLQMHPVAQRSVVGVAR